MATSLTIDERLDRLAMLTERMALDTERREREGEQRRQEVDRILKGMDDSHKRMAAAHAEMETALKKTQETVGNLGGRFGVLIEQLLVPGICPLMNDHGHNFTTVVPTIILRKTKQQHTQIDLMLYNTTEAMAVEIKSKLDQDDVKHHIDRLQKLRALEDHIFIKGLTLYGALAALVIDERARKLALDSGLYVIEIREDEDRLTAEPPQEGKIGTW